MKMNSNRQFVLVALAIAAIGAVGVWAENLVCPYATGDALGKASKSFGTVYAKHAARDFSVQSNLTVGINLVVTGTVTSADNMVYSGLGADALVETFAFTMTASGVHTQALASKFSRTNDIALFLIPEAAGTTNWSLSALTTNQAIFAGDGSHKYRGFALGRKP